MQIKPDLSIPLVRLPNQRTVIPRRFTAVDRWTPDNAEEIAFSIELVIDVDDLGRPACRHFGVAADDPDTVSGALLRTVSIPELTRRATLLAASLFEFDSFTPGGGAKLVGASPERVFAVYGLHAEKARKPRQGSPITREHLEEVASIYKRALRRRGVRRAPTQAVETTMNVSHSTAARWVSLARGAGLLGKAQHGKATE